MPRVSLQNRLKQALYRPSRTHQPPVLMVNIARAGWYVPSVP